MKSTLLTLTAIILLTSTRVLAGAEGKGGGAGCPQSDGSVITLVECGAYDPNAEVKPPAPPPAQTMIDGHGVVPEYIDDLVQYISSYPWLSDEVKAKLVQAIKPTFLRKYYYVDQAPDLPNKIVDRILEEFQRYTGLDPRQLILYGVTDTTAKLSHVGNYGQITYLLPPYQKLKTKEEKMTALLHESLWIYFADFATYEKVVAAEVAFERAYQKPDDSLLAIEFVKSLPFAADVIPEDPHFSQLLLKHDLETGALAGFVKSDGKGHYTVTSYQLLGQENINCQYTTKDHCDIIFANYVDELRRTYPNSLFISRMEWMGQTEEHETIGRVLGLPSRDNITGDWEYTGCCTQNGDNERYANVIRVYKAMYDANLEGKFWRDRLFWGPKYLIPKNKNVTLRLSIDPKDYSPIVPL